MVKKIIDIKVVLIDTFGEYQNRLILKNPLHYLYEMKPLETVIPFDSYANQIVTVDSGSSDNS